MEKDSRVCGACRHWDYQRAQKDGDGNEAAQCHRFPGQVIAVPVPKMHLMTGEQKLEVNFQTVVPFKAALERCGEWEGV